MNTPLALEYFENSLDCGLLSQLTLCDAGLPMTGSDVAQLPKAFWSVWTQGRSAMVGHAREYWELMRLLG